MSKTSYKTVTCLLEVQMIHKIEKLVSIGKFRNYQSSGDVAFRKLTLFYADNGSGKTTLTAIFRSLTQGKPDIVTNRMSLNPNVSQSAQIIQKNSRGENVYHTFRVAGWSNPFPDIEIFDVHFVNENIYSGFDFNEEHKKQLHEFVIGAQGIVIKQKIEENKREKALVRQTIIQLETQIIQQVGNGLNEGLLATFTSLRTTEVDDIDRKIEDAKVVLHTAKANEVIQTLRPLEKLSNINLGIDFEIIARDLNTTTKTIQNETLKKVFNEHCTDLIENSIESPENWLRVGYKYLDKKKGEGEAGPSNLQCPFCKQEISFSLEIVNAYVLLFDDELNAFIQRLHNHLAAITSYNADTSIQLNKNIHVNNTTKAETWSRYLLTGVCPIYPNTDYEEALKEKLLALIISVSKKTQNPLAEIGIEDVLALKAAVMLINNHISHYNQNVTAYNDLITNLRQSVITEQQAQNTLNLLYRTKKRYDPAIDTLCNELTNQKQYLTTLEQAYRQLVEQERVTATALFSSYKERINYYLGTVFRTPFRIENVVNISPQGRATQSKIGYKLTINGYDIAFDTSQPYSTKDCLSEGDKSTIALAFFLAKIDLDTNKANKILFIDDPLSSFDTNRRLYTVQIIQELLPHVKQIVVLSHNEYFLYELSKSIARGEKKTLRICEDFTCNASKIELLDLDELVEIDYFKHIKELEGFLINPDISKKDRVLGIMRNVLEAHIQFKFYRQTRATTDSSRTFGKLIDELEQHRVVFRNDTTPPSIISKLRTINAISCKPHHGEPIPHYVPSTIGVTELANFVRDTLDLIDNRL